MYELRNKERISVAAASRLLANTMQVCLSVIIVESCELIFPEAIPISSSFYAQTLAIQGLRAFHGDNDNGMG